MNLEHAVATAALSHAGQKDIVGNPAILHPLSVLQRVRNCYGPNHPDSKVMMAAVLHDTVEDTELSLVNIEDTTAMRLGTSLTR